MTQSEDLEKSANAVGEEDCSICETLVDFERIRRAFARHSTAEILNLQSLITTDLSRLSLGHNWKTSQKAQRQCSEEIYERLVP